MRLSGEIPLRITVSVSGTSYALGRSDRFGSQDQKHSEQFRVPESTYDVTIPEQAWCSMLVIQCCSLFFLPTFYLNIVNVRAFVFRVPLILNG